MIPLVCSAFFIREVSSMRRHFVVIAMKLTIIVLISFLLVSCGGGGGGGGPRYSNATLTGVWMMKLTSPVIVYSSFKFDGSGNMIVRTALRSPGKQKSRPETACF